MKHFVVAVLMTGLMGVLAFAQFGPPATPTRPDIFGRYDIKGMLDTSAECWRAAIALQELGAECRDPQQRRTLMGTQSDLCDNVTSTIRDCSCRPERVE